MTSEAHSPELPPGVAADAGADGAPRQERFSARQVGRGGAWTVVGYGIVQVIRFASTMAMTRLLTKTDFGVMQIFWAMSIGLHMLSDVGIAANLVQNPRGAEREFRSTAWSLAILRGLAIAVVALLLAPFVERVFAPDEYPGLADLTRALGILSILYGLGATSLDILNRNLAVRRVLSVEIGTQVVTTVTMIVWASLSPTPWAMVGGSAAGAIFKLAMGHAVFGADRLGWHTPSARAILQFGKWAFVSSALMFAVQQADRPIFGSLIPAELLAGYGLAMTMAMLVPELVQRLVGTVAFPAWCRTVQLNEPLAPVFLRYRRPLLLLAGWSMAGICGGGRALIELFFPPEWADSGWVLQFLAAGFWFGIVLLDTHSRALLALGLPRLVAVSSLAKVVGMVSLIPLGFHLGGFPGAVVGYALSDLLRYAASAVATHTVGLRGLSQDLRATACFAATAFAGDFAVRQVVAAGHHAAVQCLTVFVVVTALWSPLLLATWREMRGLLLRNR